jgi:DNA-binding NarL/FixJ family response regulator
MSENDQSHRSPSEIRVVIVDDQPLVRSGISFIISTEPAMNVVSEAANGELALVAVESHSPDIVLMDIRMPVMDGITAMRELHEAGGPPVLVLTTFDDDDVLWGALQAGAAGFLLKDTSADDLIAAIGIVARGGSWLDPRVTPRVLDVARNNRRVGGTDIRGFEKLSERELEVLRLIASGASNPEIAESLYVSERTIKGHVSSIFAKLGARDRAAAIILAFEAGLVLPGLPPRHQ